MTRSPARLLATWVFAWAAIGHATAAEPFEIDTVTRTEVNIRAAPATIWPYLFDPTPWKASVRSITLESGTSNHELYAVERMFTETEGKKGELLIRNLAVDENKRRVVKITEPNSDRVLGYGSYELYPHGNGTLLVYDVATHYRFEQPPTETKTPLKETLQASAQRRLDAEHAVLKQMIEEGVRGR